MTTPRLAQPNTDCADGERPNPCIRVVRLLPPFHPSKVNFASQSDPAHRNPEFNHIIKKYENS